jgi:hypothetical protein
MAQLSRTNFKTLYGSSGTTFPDNTSGSIAEGDVRQFGEDLADSFWNKVTDLQGLTTSTNVSNAYSVTGGITAYAAGFTIFVKFNAANTGAATLNVNSLGAIAIKKNGAEALITDDIAANQIYILQYDGTNFQIAGRHGASKAYVDTQVASVSSGNIATVSLVIPTADVLLLKATPYQLVAAPGAGNIIIPLSVIVSMDYNSIQYTNGQSPILIMNSITISDSASSMLAAAADRLKIFQLLDTNFSNDISSFTNQALKLSVSEGNDPSGGNSDLKVVVVYKVVTI